MTEVNRRGVRARQAIARELIRQLKDKPCAVCGIQYPPYVMQFNHVRGVKSYNIGAMQSYSLTRIIEEAAKCEVVCANCHAELTHQGQLDGTTKRGGRKAQD